MKTKVLLTCAAIAAISASANTPSSAPQVFVTEPELGTYMLPSDEPQEAECVHYNEATTRTPLVQGDTVLYYEPQEFVYPYISNSGSWYNTYYSKMICSAYAPATFKNKSVGVNVNNFTWSYDFGEDTNRVSTDTDLTVSYPKAKYLVPELHSSDLYFTPAKDATHSTASITGSLVYAGGNAASTWGLLKDTCYVVPFNLTQVNRGSTGSPTFGRFNNLIVCKDTPVADSISASTTATTLFPNTSKLAYKGIAQRFPAMGRKYLINNVMVRVYATDSIDAGNTISGKIYAIGDNTSDLTINRSLSLLGTFSYTNAGGDAKKKGATLTAITTAQTKDALTGLISEGVVVPANTPILITFDEFTGFDRYQPLYYFYSNYQPDYRAYHTNNLFFLCANSNGDQMYILSDAGTSKNTTWGAAYNTAIAINADYDYIYSPETEVTIPLAGGEYTISNCATWYGVGAWRVDEDLDEVGEIDSWLKYKFAAGTKADGSSDSWHPSITFTAEKTTSPREATMTIYNLEGCDECVITVRQTDNTGVDNVAVQAVKISKVGENFEVVASESTTSVAVYNVNGQLVATHALTIGTNTVNAANLNSGVYVFKFNNGVTVKAIK